MFLHLSVILFRGGLCQGRVSVQGGGLYLGGSVQGGHCPGDLPLPSYGNERAVQILLECILQVSHFSYWNAFFRVPTFLD